MIDSCFEQFGFCLCVVAGCFVNVAFLCICVLSDDPAAFYVYPV